MDHPTMAIFIKGQAAPLSGSIGQDLLTTPSPDGGAKSSVKAWLDANTGKLHSSYVP